MNAEIEKLIASVKETGSMTARQKEIILEKAKELGEDPSEVEFVLENIPIRDPSSPLHLRSENKKRTCPHCGALISGITMTCPECGFALPSESNANKEYRSYTLELQQKIDQIRSRNKRKNEDEFDYEENQAKEIVNAIQSFSIPITQEGLTQVMVYCYSRFEAAENYTSEKVAWLSKAKEFYLLLNSVTDKDQGTKKILEKYLFIMNKKAKDGWALVKVIYSILGICAVVAILICWWAGVFN